MDVDYTYMPDFPLMCWLYLPEWTPHTDSPPPPLPHTHAQPSCFFIEIQWSDLIRFQVWSCNQWLINRSYKWRSINKTDMKPHCDQFSSLISIVLTCLKTTDRLQSRLCWEGWGLMNYTQDYAGRDGVWWTTLKTMLRGMGSDELHSRLGILWDEVW